MTATKSFSRRVQFWLLFAAMAAVYLAMLVWTLPHLQALSGAPAFDLRPMGYDLAEAKAELRGLGPDGRAFYLRWQHGLDLVYPGLLAAVLVLSFRALSGAWAARVLSVLAVLSGLADYAENLSVRQMLLAGPDAVTRTMVGWASGLTVTKSALVSVSLTALVVLAVRAGYVWARGGRDRRP